MEYDQQQDVVYGYEDGMALVMDVFTTKNQSNGRGIIWIAAAGWRIDLPWRRDALNNNPGQTTPRSLTRALVDAGFTVFAVAHRSPPKYTIDDIRPDVSRAVRFIRHHADRFEIDPQRIGIIGGSSGGHISLLTATAPPTPDPEAEDLVDRESSEVQAVVAYFPITDLLNFGGDNANISDFWIKLFMKEGIPAQNARFDFHRWDEEAQRFERITDAAERNEYFRRNSPIEHLRANMPPVLLFHGDRDRIVPIQQSERLVARLEELDVVHNLIVLPDQDHAWPEPSENGQDEVIDWFGQHLLGSNT